jgi:hypothetical protein
MSDDDRRGSRGHGGWYGDPEGLSDVGAVAGFIAAAKKTRIWDREPKVRKLP